MVQMIKDIYKALKISFNRDTKKRHYFACLEAAGVMKYWQGGPDFCYLCNAFIDKKFSQKKRNHLITHHMNHKKLLQINKDFFKILKENLKKSGQ